MRPIYWHITRFGLCTVHKHDPSGESSTDVALQASSESNPLDYLILGAGPAGVQLAYELRSSGATYQVLEAAQQAGDFFAQYPRHRTLISINKVYTGCDDPRVNLRWDWNSLLTDDHSHLFKQFDRKYFPDADSLIRYLNEFVEKFQLNVRYGAGITSIQKDGLFRLVDQNDQEYFAKSVVIATGAGLPVVPEIDGIELAECYSKVSVDPEDFAGQRVLIIGKGNSAFETADNLVSTTSLIHLVSPAPVKFAWRTHHVGHLRAVNNNILDTYQLKSQNALLDAEVVSIRKLDGALAVAFRYQHADEEVEEIVYDRVIYATGFRFDDSIFDESCQPELAVNERFPMMSSSWESTNVGGLYFAGVLMQSRDFKKKQSAFIHGFRYNVRTLGRLLREKYQAQVLPSVAVQRDSMALAQAVLDRVNQSSALWQQDGFLCDLIVADGTGDLTYIPEMACDYVADRWGEQESSYFTVTMEFGHEKINAAKDVFAIPRPHKDDVDRADESWAIHPIVRQWRGKSLLATHHVIEDLQGVWDADKHLNPLAAFFAQALPRVAGVGTVTPKDLGAMGENRVAEGT